MPAYYRVHIDGGYAGNAETWSVSMAVTSDGSAVSTEDLNTWADAIMGLLAGSSGGATVVKGLISSNGRIRRVRIYRYADVGSPATHQGASTAAEISGSGTAQQACQVSLVVSLMTGFPGGRNRGRMYFPAVGAGITTAGTTGSGSQGNATNLAALLASIAEGSPESTLTLPAVVSEAASAVTAVTSIRLGNVPDTQRRRRDALVETYYVAAIP